MTSLDVTMALVVGALFAAGVHLLLQRSLMRIVLGIILLGHGANLLLLEAGGPLGEPPITGGGPDVDVDAYSDPLPQAMALTAIVITFGVTTFLLALSHRSWRLTGHDEVQNDPEDRRIGDVAERADDDPAPHLPPEDRRDAG
ncbi:MULTISPECIES: Na(+)/H(+) antiporter subunit C [Streptomyces]|uniref:Na(+)/H(+) antiporter subunit C n=1 Tax=Streptomyces chilikensis TaxID=1194079 RepID=A0ABV3EQJ4_9ACTN|nr:MULTISPECIES: Na(+)/H(+) antiporter subunit C [Streptomyces]MDH6224421.1 multicomponent Na+:H+ antiporter subunit C [Streptomyces sp. MJP52]